MKTWQRRTKIKPRVYYNMVGCVPCCNAKERHEAELFHNIYKKRVFWPDRLIPLTEEEQELDSRPGLTLEQFNAALNEFSKEVLGPSDNTPVLVSEKFLERLSEEERDERR